MVSSECRAISCFLIRIEINHLRLKQRAQANMYLQNIILSVKNAGKNDGEVIKETVTHLYITWKYVHEEWDKQEGSFIGHWE